MLGEVVNDDFIRRVAETDVVERHFAADGFRLRGQVGFVRHFLRFEEFKDALGCCCGGLQIRRSLC